MEGGRGQPEAARRFSVLQDPPPHLREDRQGSGGPGHRLGAGLGACQGDRSRLEGPPQSSTSSQNRIQSKHWGLTVGAGAPGSGGKALATEAPSKERRS